MIDDVLMIVRPLRSCLYAAGYRLTERKAIDRLTQSFQRAASGCTRVELMVMTATIGVVTAIAVLGLAGSVRAEFVHMDASGMLEPHELRSRAPTIAASANVGREVRSARDRRRDTVAGLKLCDSARAANSGIRFSSEVPTGAERLKCY